MRRRKSVRKGYIVLIEEQGVGELTKKPLKPKDKTWPKTGLLLEGITATLFPTSYLAKKAIKRTLNYASVTNHTEWPDSDSYRVVPVQRVV